MTTIFSIWFDLSFRMTPRSPTVCVGHQHRLKMGASMNVFCSLPSIGSTASIDAHDDNAAAEQRPPIRIVARRPLPGRSFSQAP